MDYTLLSEKQEFFANTYENAGRRGILYISVRVGKTRIGLLTIKKGTKVLVTYPWNTIKKGWKDDIEKFKFEGFDITFSTFRSLPKIIIPGEDPKFDQIIVDEPQMLSFGQRKLIKGSGVKEVLALSGTLSTETKNQLKDDSNLKILATYKLEDAINEGFVRDYRLIVHEVPMNSTSNTVKYTKFGKEFSATEQQVYDYYTEQMKFWKEKELEAVNENPPNYPALGKAKAIYRKNMNLRTNFIYNSPTLFNEAFRFVTEHSEEKVLIFTMRTSIADKLSPEVFHSGSEDEETLEGFKLAHQGSLATVNVMSMGVTIHGINKIVFHSATSNTETFVQKIARGLQYTEESEKPCDIHVFCLKGTVQENWVDQASRGLDVRKITLILEDGIEISKIDYMKKLHPDVQLYVYEGSFCYESGVDEKGYTTYKFISGSDTEYSLLRNKLLKV